MTAPPTTAPSGADLAIRNFAFAPNPLRIRAGTTVTVTNHDGATHTWTADGGGWDSGQIPSGGTARHTFTTAGSFSYHCNIHPSMTGTVQVS